MRPPVVLVAELQSGSRGGRRFWNNSVEEVVGFKNSETLRKLMMISESLSLGLALSVVFGNELKSIWRGRFFCDCKPQFLW